MSKASAKARARWARIIREQRRSGRTVAAFCAERGLAESSFYPWKRRLAAAVPPAPPGAFVEAKVRGVDDELRVGVGGTGRVGGIVIELSRDRRVLVERGFDRVLLLEVMAAQIYKGFGRWSSVCSAIVCWALIPAEPD